MSYNQIAVDSKKLAAILGIEEMPIGMLDREEFRIAARILTDSHGCSDPVSAMGNAVAWVSYARNRGKETGRAETEKAWQDRIRGIFGIKPGLGE